MYTTLLTDLTDHILTITINRPDKLNALNAKVITELGEAVSEIYENKEIKSAIITGAGRKAFVAGADISEFQGLSRDQGQALAAKGGDVFLRIVTSPKPIVAAVNGFALGGGCELAMACHFRLCTPNARFGQPEVNLGLIPGYGGTQRLTALVGKGRALEIMLSARMIEATEAHVMGLVNYITEPDDLLVKTRELLGIINEKAPLAIARIIECANLGVGDGIAYADNPYLREQEAFGECFATEDLKEGAAAFLEKRKPVFKGK